MPYLAYSYTTYVIAYIIYELRKGGILLPLKYINILKVIKVIENIGKDTFEKVIANIQEKLFSPTTQANETTRYKLGRSGGKGEIDVKF